MKHVKKLTILSALAISCFTFADLGFAASQCTNIDTSAAAAGTFPGNTCPGGTKPGLNSGLTPFCSGDAIPNGNGAYIFAVPIGAGNSGLTFKVVSSTSGFNPEMALMAAPCDADPSGGACYIDDTNGTQTVGPDAPSPAITTGGTYYLIVTDLSAETPGCGAFNMTIAGALPVKLENFSIQ